VVWLQHFPGFGISQQERPRLHTNLNFAEADLGPHFGRK